MILAKLRTSSERNREGKRGKARKHKRAVEEESLSCPSFWASDQGT